MSRRSIASWCSRFLAVFHPEAVYERTRVETTVAEHVFRTSGRVLIEAGWKAVYGEEADADRDDDDSGGDQTLPKLDLGEAVDTLSVESLAKETQATEALHGGIAPRCHGDRGQGHRGRDAARGDEGFGDRYACHAGGDHRAADVGRIPRARRSCASRNGEGRAGDRPARPASAHLARADRPVGAQAWLDRARRGSTRAVHGRHRAVHGRDGGGSRQARRTSRSSARISARVRCAAAM